MTSGVLRDRLGFGLFLVVDGDAAAPEHDTADPVRPPKESSEASGLDARPEHRVMYVDEAPLEGQVVGVALVEALVLGAIVQGELGAAAVGAHGRRQDLDAFEVVSVPVCHRTDVLIEPDGLGPAGVCKVVVSGEHVPNVEADARRDLVVVFGPVDFGWKRGHGGG